MTIELECNSCSAALFCVTGTQVHVRSCLRCNRVTRMAFSGSSSVLSYLSAAALPGEFMRAVTRCLVCKVSTFYDVGFDTPLRCSQCAPWGLKNGREKDVL